ncbi:Pleiotropic regulatory protein [Carbonactinospora thermoautotrophica]|uniref:Pleiotropic regulatory protein n=1 Tax=Carbonactinospora thermoautotrophica TaxID=1469144 RepID=A0A132ML36_9ACTN|nr:aminotransferase class I/II-fold pyridoxal phosphate-dependent enzyme [Carbonactinospora thermoautotrophica]KWW98587.1 Pleiotropic regulatory protein [Carbonactinospora thermoautotrophica]
MSFDAAVYQYSHLTVDHQRHQVDAALTAGRIATLGARYIPRLERRAAALLGRAEAIAVDSGSSGLVLALRGLGVRPGQEVIIPEVGWVSMGAAAASLGAGVRVAAVTETLTPTWEQIAPLITPATGAVILAHLRGRPAPDTPRIAAELSARGIPLVEDCAQAWGVTAAGRPAGAWGQAAVLSTNTYKIIATGEGGLVLADEPRMLGFMRAVAGDTRQPTPQAVWRGKSRMNELTAALALPQLDFLPTLLDSLRALQQHVISALATVEGITGLAPATAEDTSQSNGSLVGMWLPTATHAEQAADALFRAGFRCWWPGPGDLHTAAAWPVQPEQPVVDVRRYLDVQIPWLPAGEHAAFAHQLAATLTAALKESPC